MSAAVGGAGTAAAPIVHEFRTSHVTLSTLRAKVLVLGDASVGKTALIRMLESGGSDYPKNYVMTAAVEAHACSIRTSEPKAGHAKQVELQLLDVPGASIFNQRDDSVAQVRGRVTVHARVVLRVTVHAAALTISSVPPPRAICSGSPRPWSRSCLTSAAKSRSLAAPSGCGAPSTRVRAATPPPARRSLVRLPAAVRASRGAAQSYRACLHACTYTIVVAGVLIGNKVDHREAGTDRAEVTVEEAKAFATSVGLAYFETSAVSCGCGSGDSAPLADLASRCRSLHPRACCSAASLQERAGQYAAPFEHLAKEWQKAFDAEVARLEAL